MDELINRWIRELMDDGSIRMNGLTISRINRQLDE
jgi:hypothetical protein